MLLGWLSGIVSGHQMPLQSLLFWQRRHRRDIEVAVERFAPDTVYFDGVRTGAYLPGLSRQYPGLRLVCDFDDLMSRRMAYLVQNKQPVSLGYMAKYFPGWVERQYASGHPILTADLGHA
ncbi:hypothetical protein [Rhodoferax lacus]|nr:hypothetical protein [Rhodoferax lacus]